MCRCSWVVFALLGLTGLAYHLRLRKAEDHLQAAPLHPVSRAKEHSSELPLKIHKTGISLSSREQISSIESSVPSLAHPRHLRLSDMVDSPGINDRSLTAVLPVTLDNFGDLDNILEPLLDDGSSVHAIIILCPPNLLSSLHSVVRNNYKSFLLEFFVLPWMEDWDEGAAVANAVSQVATEWILLLGTEGLRQLNIDSIDLLLNPPPMDAPVGPCGVILSDQEITSPSSIGEHHPASFLVPPFVVPTRLILDINDIPRRAARNWVDMGNRISHARYDNIGGFVLEASDEGQDWCLEACRRATIDAEQDFALSTSKGELLSEQNASPTERPQHFTSELRLPTMSVAFAIILPSPKHLEDFSLAICRMQENGYQVRTLLTAHRNVNGTGGHISRDHNAWAESKLISKHCTIAFDTLYNPSSRFALSETMSSWLVDVAEEPPVIISSGIEGSQTLLAFELHQRALHGTVVVNIPHEDLAHSEWVGTLSLTEWKNWDVPRLELSIVTNDRPISLLRLLSSLQAARFFGDTVDLRINMEQTADQETQALVRNFKWSFGKVFIHHRVIHGGLLTAVAESWYPQSNDSYGIILEDDVELSPLFYAWTKMALLRYRYGSLANKSPSMFGISLYQQKNVELRPDGRKPFNARAILDAHGYEHAHTPYLSQIPCSWGAVYFPEHWREFHSYLAVRFSEVSFPIDETVALNLRSNNWTKSWKKFFIELVYLRGYVMLYPNYKDFVSLSTNHLEVGSHVKNQPGDIYREKKSMFIVPLMTLPNETDLHSLPNRLLDLPQNRMPPWSQLPILDLVGSVATEDELRRRGKTRQKELTGCDTIASTSSQHSSFDPRELFICTRLKD